MGKEFGSRTYATVFLVRHMPTMAIVDLKFMKKNERLQSYMMVVKSTFCYILIIMVDVT